MKGGLTVQQFAARQAANGFNVWRSWDEPGGLRDELRETARENPKLTKLVRLGTDAQRAARSSRSRSPRTPAP